MSWHPTLDDIERRPDGPQTRPKIRDNREPSTRRMAPGGPGCWCGETQGHDWPGKDDGAPHPRHPRMPGRAAAAGGLADETARARRARAS